MRLVLKRRNLPDNMYDYKVLALLFIVFMASGFLGVALYDNLIVRIIITLIVLVVVLLNGNRLIGSLKKFKE